MNDKKKGGFAGKHPASTKINPEIKSAIETKATEGVITCAAAHGLAEKLKVSPSEVGVTLDLINYRIEKCQLGLFGYKPNKKAVTPAEAVDPGLESALKEKLNDNRIACADCWAIADRLNIKRMDASAACEALGIKVSPCQLGAF
jgi:hypothetical protein